MQLIDNFSAKSNDDISKCCLNEIQWDNGRIIYIDEVSIKFKGKYFPGYLKNIEEIIREYKKYKRDLCYENDKLFFDYRQPDNPNSLLGKYINEENKLMNSIYELFENINDSIFDLRDYNNYANEQINDSVTNFEEISKDLKNYKDGYLKKVEYYVKVGKGCGYILVMIYFSLLSIISICGCFLLLAYTYLSNQGNLEKLMHIVWNSIKFFSFSFLMYGAAFGILTKGLRDLIAYNMFLFGNNLKESNNTYVLPKEKAKYFLVFCLNEEKAEYKGEIDDIISSILDKFFLSFEEIDILLQKENSFNNYYKENYTLTKKRLRNIDETNLQEDESSEIYETENNTINSDQINANFSKSIYHHINMINQVNKSFDELKKISKINDSAELKNISISNSNSYNCGFLKSDVNLLYNSLYDLSVESRILFILSCCIGFFGEALIYFYLLSMYHYNNIEFKEGKLDMNKSGNRTRNNIEEGSRNEFMDKSQPANMRKFNKYLDKDFNKDFSTSVRKGLK